MKKVLCCLAVACFSLCVSCTASAINNKVIKLETDQGEVSLNDYKGKVVLLDFWASWCTPCRQSFSWMNTLHHRYNKDGLVIIAVNLDKNRILADRFLKNSPANFQIAYDPKGKLALDFQLEAMPSSYLIDRNGNIVKTHQGFKREEIANYEHSILTLLEEPQYVSIK